MAAHVMPGGPNPRAGTGRASCKYIPSYVLVSPPAPRKTCWLLPLFLGSVPDMSDEQERTLQAPVPTEQQTLDAQETLKRQTQAEEKPAKKASKKADAEES